MGQQQQQQQQQEQPRQERRRCHLKNKKAGGGLGGGRAEAVPLKKIKRLEGGWGEGAAPPPQMHGLQFQTPFSRLLPGPLPLACLFVWLSAMTRLLGIFFSSRSFSKLALSSFYLFPWCRYYIPTCLCVSIDWSQPSFVSIECLSLS